MQVGGISQKHVEKFKYVGVIFASNERQDEELDVRSHKASAMMRALHHLVILKPELSRKAKLLVFKSILVPTLTYGHEFRVMTERNAVTIACVRDDIFAKNQRSCDIKQSL